MPNTERYRCPYADCGFEGTETQVDDHRTTGVHHDQPQAGSNIRASGTLKRLTTSRRPKLAGD